ncbi:MAG: GNAT family N-acetyltransferase [candidate division KSB1 bacterium]|nr:GNAT family N-acetyltransferase [candidate division KSB1 bacterium]MDZ7368260.1 GNAT family N-acetyltransferase [candidate division KSB1 bacterium]MDZ7406758.1 GNAT family N-acetyltransferase [candidate division KSB1 bacterium]
MTIRQLADTDIEMVLALWNRSAKFDPMTPELFEEKVFDDPDFRREWALVAEEQNRVVGFIMALSRNFQDDKVGFVKLLAVDPARQRSGIGTQLLQRVESALWHAGVSHIRVLDSNPNYLQPGLDPRYTEAIIFFESHGYKRFAETMNMEVDLTSRDFNTTTIEEHLRAKGIEIRRAIMGDREDLMRLLERHWPAWIPEVDRTLLNYPISLHVAVQQNRLIGFSAYDGNNFNTGWFGPMGTDPALQGRGVGGVLLLRCLQDIKNQGHRFAVIPWVGPYRFYSHYAGARISRVFWRYKKEVAS